MLPLEEVRHTLYKTLKDWTLTHRLLTETLHVQEVDLFAHGENPIPSDQVDLCLSRAQRIKRGEPLAYVLEEVVFFGLPLKVEPGVFIPRPETERCVEIALQLPLPSRSRVIDGGTGTGCIALALKKARQTWWILGVDRDPRAIKGAEKNSQKLNLPVHWVLADWFKSFNGPFDLVITNPPYISKKDYANLSPSITQFEPPMALLGGEDGLDHYRILIPQIKDLLKPQGFWVTELGYDQKESLARLAQEGGVKVLAFYDDFNGIPRVMVCQK